MLNDQSFLSPQFAYLSENQCRKIHWAALEILERVGVRLYLEEAVSLLRAAGADVADGNLVKVPCGLVERAFTTVPRRVVLADRHGRRVMPIEGHRSYLGPGSDCLNIVDHRTGIRRKPVLQDVVEGVTLCDALSEIDFVMSMVLPADVDTALADRYQMEVLLSRTIKPLVFVTYEFAGCLDAVAMAEIVAGGADALRRSPHIACYINVTSGLRHNAEALEKLLFLAGKGLPAIYVPVARGGITGPVTSPGAVATILAGVLVGLVLSQFKREGAPFLMPGWGGSIIDLRTTVSPYCHPTGRGIMQAMGHHYRLPMFSLGGASESKTVDGQAAAEAALTLMSEILSGGNLIHDLGYLESGLTFSFAQLVLVNEIARWIRSYTGEVQVDEATLAVDLVDQVGHDGQYLDLDHTYAHFRQHWYPELFERGSFEDWHAAGARTVAQRAAERVEAILAEHRPEPLPAGITRQLREVVERAGG